MQDAETFAKWVEFDYNHQLMCYFACTIPALLLLSVEHHFILKSHKKIEDDD